jgi:magnesium transporter
MYYVGFSSATIIASLILFQGFNTTDATNIMSLIAGFIVTFLGVHLLNISRVSDPPLDHPNGEAHTHSALAGGLMNPRLSLQGRMSLDGWNGVGNAPDRGIDVHMDGIRRPGGRHGRQSSVYQSQTTTLFNAFEETDGDPGMLPAASHPRQQQQQHQQQRKRSNSTDLRRLREVDESVDGDDEGGDGDRRALLRKGKPRQQHHQQQSRQPRATAGSRNHSHSPETNSSLNSSLTDVRITPR